MTAQASTELTHRFIQGKGLPRGWHNDGIIELRIVPQQRHMRVSRLASAAREQETKAE
ncbi:hypothetical protein GCM10023333_14330 [Ferrimonas pelagia]|uniref:Uncharacterized protein n=1 Tax=Ferrimonas pelagia TaxID=1177826 RepID=A0ABP9ELY6_9GAMM